MAKKDKTENGVVVIKKYANRRLYNTETSCYVTLDYLAQMVKDDRDFVVRDAKSGDDITHSVLTQIIFEEESKGNTLLPTPFLRQLIGFYGHGMEAIVPTYLQTSMETFIRNQEQVRALFTKGKSTAGAFPFEDMVRQNMTMFSKAMEMFQPFADAATSKSGAVPKAKPPAPEPAPARASDASDDDSDHEIAELKAQLAAMQEQLSALADKKSS